MAWTKAKTAILVGVGVLLVTGAGILATKEVLRHSDLTAIQGTWTGQEAGVRGAASLVLQGTKLEFHGANPNEWYKATISLREKTTPKQCVVTITDCSDPDYIGKIGHSIYKIEGNTLTISGNQPGSAAVPTNFEAPKSRIFVFTKTSAAETVATTAIIPVADTKVSDAFSATPAQSSGSLAGWGDVINPDGDCVLNATNGKLTIALPGTDHVLRPERHKMNAPRVMQEVTGEFDLQVKVSGDFALNAKSVVPGRSPYQDAGLLVWLDDKNNLKLSRARITVQGRTGDYFNLEFRHEGQVGEIPFPREAWQVLRSKTVYLRLQIHSDATTASVSADGNKWFSTTLPGGGRPEKIQAGVLAENNTASPLNMEFEEFALSKVGDK